VDLSIIGAAAINGLLLGGVYTLVASGLTLIYGVLHIINFAHGALLTAAMFAVFFATSCSALILMSRRQA
jgi:branched-chain amino acid transport system permease protein